MKLELYFSEKEMIDYLEINNYKIIEVDSWYSQNEYHNKVSFVDCKVKIAYKPSVLNYVMEKVSEQDKYSIEKKYGVEIVFKDLLKYKILNIQTTQSQL